jgi:hypothetical protein
MLPFLHRNVTQAFLLEVPAVSLQLQLPLSLLKCNRLL